MMIKATDAEYLAAFYKTVAEHGTFDLIEFLSTVCNECGEDQAPRKFTDAHVVDWDTGAVLICCEGYHQVNPNLLGLDRPQWSNWDGE